MGRSWIKTLFRVTLLGVLAGAVSGATFFLLSDIFDISLSVKIVTFSSTSIGVTIAFVTEGVLKREPFKDVLLRKIFPALTGIAIAFYFIWVMGV